MTDDAQGEPAREVHPEPSVLKRIENSAGIRARVSLRDVAQLGESPLVKPIGDGDTDATGKYRIQGEIARGGVGVVMKAVDTDLGRDVAVKFLLEEHRANADRVQRFVEEAQISGQLQHPGVIPVYDLGLDGESPYFTMKLVKGRTLAALLEDRESPASNRRRLIATFLQICQTMAYAHARGVVHRDLKPANIMLGPYGEVLVVDWGMGKVLRQGGVHDERKRAKRSRAETTVIQTVRTDSDGSTSEYGSMIGTPRYMPPEQALGDVDAMDERSDVFALGAILTEILSGEPPYVGPLAEILPLVSRAEVAPAVERMQAADADPELIAIAEDCLCAKPSARPRHAGIVADRVGKWLSKVDDQLHDARVREAAARKTRNIAFGGAALVLCALAVAVFFWIRADADKQTAVEQTQKAEEAEAREREQAEIARLEREEAKAAAREAQEAQQYAQAQKDEAVAAKALVEKEAQKGATITKFLTDMIALADPQVSGKRSATILELLQKADQKIEVDLADDPVARAHLRTKIGSAYLAIGEMDAAVIQLRRAVDLLDQADAPDVALLYEAVRGLLQLARGGFDADEDYWTGRYGRVIVRALERDHPEVAASLRQVLDPGRLGPSTGASADGAAPQTQVTDPKSWIDSIGTALPLHDPQRHIVRDALVEVALTHVPTLAPEKHGFSAAQQNELRHLCWQHAIRICKEELDPGHPHVVAFTTGYVNFLWLDMRRPEDAEALARSALADAEKGISADHWRVAELKARYGRWLSSEEGREAEALPLLEESTEGLRAHYGGHNSRTFYTLARLGHVYKHEGLEDKVATVRTTLLELAKTSPQSYIWRYIEPLLPDNLQPLGDAWRALLAVEEVPAARRAAASLEKLEALLDKRDDLIPEPGESLYALALARWMVYATYSNTHATDLSLGAWTEQITQDADYVLDLWSEQAPLAVAYYYWRLAYLNNKAHMVLGMAKTAHDLYIVHLADHPTDLEARRFMLLSQMLRGEALARLKRHDEALEHLPEVTEQLLAIYGEASAGSTTRARTALVNLYLDMGRFDDARPHLARQARTNLHIMEEETRTYVEETWPAVSAQLDVFEEAVRAKAGIADAWTKLESIRRTEIGDTDLTGEAADGLYFVSKLLLTPLGQAATTGPPEEVLPCLRAFDTYQRGLYHPESATHAGTAGMLYRCLLKLGLEQALAGDTKAARDTFLEADRLLVESSGEARSYDHSLQVLGAFVAAGEPEAAARWAEPILEKPEYVWRGLATAIIYTQGLPPELYKKARYTIQDHIGPNDWTWFPTYQVAWLHYHVGEYENCLEWLKRPGVEWPDSERHTHAGMQAITYGRLENEKAATEYRVRLDTALREMGIQAFPSLARELRIVFGDQ